MDLDVIFLGTAGSVPSATRQTAATLVRRGGERILIDCGEGTQRRLMQSVAGLSDIDIILITHGHADQMPAQGSRASKTSAFPSWSLGTRG